MQTPDEYHSFHIKEYTSESNLGDDNFKHFAEALPLVAWTATPEGVIDYISPQWGFIVGVDPKSPEYYNWLDKVHPEEKDSTLELWGEAISLGKVYEQEFRILSKTGEYLWFCARAIPVINDKDLIVKWYGTTTNIHKQKLLELKLRKNAKEKDDFIAMLSHELRNPLSAISSAFEVTENPVIDKEQKERASQILGQQLTHLKRLVDDTLDISRLKSGKFQLIKQDVELCHLVENSFKSVIHDIQTQQIKCLFIPSSDLLWIRGDTVRLNQCVINLLNNAAKFTLPGGTITVEVLRKGDNAVIKVKDSGIGIPKEDLENLFHAFHQGTNATEQNKNGLGLGLAVIKKLVELHSGIVSATSEGLSKGAEFTISIPLIEPPITQEPSLKNTKLKSTSATQNVLIIEDNNHISEMLKILIELEGHTVSVVENGEEAFEYLHKTVPDIIISDLSLPGTMSGWEIAKRVSMSMPKEKIPYMVALSGHAQPKDIRKSFKAGFHRHLSKPPELEEIRQCLKNSAFYKETKFLEQLTS